jgi:hypothetical protein
MLMSLYPTQALTQVAITDLAWFTGNWQGQYGTDPVEEYWSPPANGTLMGMFRWLRGEQVRFYELIIIEPDGPGLIMRFKHFNPGLLGWEEKDQALAFVLVQADASQAIFWQQGVDQPEWLVYEHPDAQTLIVYFQREGDVVPEEKKFIYRQS